MLFKHSIPTRLYFHPNIVNTTVMMEKMLTPQLLELPHGAAEMRMGGMRNEFVKMVIKQCRFRDHGFHPYFIWSYSLTGHLYHAIMPLQQSVTSIGLFFPPLVD